MKFYNRVIYSGTPCIINTASVRDSTIIYNGNVGTAVDLVELQQCKYIVLKKFLQVKIFSRNQYALLTLEFI